ncbi:hypothetical protein ISG33_10190 [Glaciecola sp. MH2013]|uniref:hypothetical protein n=1 Tax=Glaciecola sp. MH2013 TaxID=2785524 RepID=UPI00189FED5B|nr:hypothetical protein [Glaciecola sp. MH2013]MBF7073766.1 hypothetical protein [Glaciecola sp. MH2013]
MKLSSVTTKELSKKLAAKITATAAVLCICVALSLPTVTTTNFACLSNIADNEVTLSSSQSQQICEQTSTKLNWLTWIMNKTDSNQFHFLDLLELLSKDSAD